MHGAPLRIVQISDTHLYATPDKALLGVNTCQSFEALIKMLKNDNLSPHLIILTGDLAQDGDELSYLQLAEKMNIFQVPVYCVPGNHDNSLVMQKVFPRKPISMERQLVFDDWQIILLDSHIHGKVEGYLDQTQLDFMEKCLKSYPEHSAIIVFHHHPIPVGCKWLDKIGLKNSDEFWQLAARFPQINTILFGHVHQQCEGIQNNIRYYSTPSTCIQFKRDSAEFALDELPPAYRVVDLYPKGELKTYVKRLDKYIGKFDPDATGY